MGRSILHLIDSLDPRAGGPVEFVKSVSKEHAAMGHTVSAALLTHYEGPTPEGLEIRWMGKKREFGGYGFQPGLVAWLRAEATRHDAIFVHGLWQYHGAAAGLALSSRTTPYHLFPHGMLDPWFTGNRGRHAKKRLYWNVIEKQVARRARAVWFTSEAERERAPLSFGEAMETGCLAAAGDSRAAGWRRLGFSKPLPGFAREAGHSFPRTDRPARKAASCWRRRLRN